MARYLKTNDIAREVGIHANTVRLYEEQGFFPPIPRGENNNYRMFTPMHLEHARLIRLALEWPYVAQDKDLLIALVMSAAQGDYGMAMERAYRYLADVRVERTYAEAAIEFLERWAAGFLLDTPRERVTIKEAARHLNVSIDMLRNWERNGLIDVPRDPNNGYRLYATVEFGRLRVIRMLVQSGYSLMAILQMFRQFDTGKTENLRDALYVPPHEDDTIEVIADRWLASLLHLEERAQSVIQQLTHIITLAHTK